MVVISPHKFSALRSELVEQHGAKYWIGSDAGLRTLISYVVPNTVAEFPMTYLVDARGTVVDTGEKLEAKIEYLLQEVFEPDLGRELHAELAAARADFDTAAIGAAWTAAAAHLASEDAQLAADAKFLRAHAESYGAWKKLMLERQIEAGALPGAVRALKKMERTFAGMDVAAWAAKTRSELEQDPQVKMEAVLGVPFDPALGRELASELGIARRHYEKGAFGSAWRIAGQKLDDEDPEVVADARFLRERCEESAEWRRYTVMRKIQQRDYPKAVPELQELARTFKGMPTAEWAKETRSGLRKDPAVRLELKAWARLERAITKAEKAGGDPRKMKSVHREYAAIQEAYPDTRAAREAARRLAR
jgi:hypothetical protein